MSNRTAWSVLSALIILTPGLYACSDSGDDGASTAETSGTSNNTSNGTTGNNATSNGTASNTTTATSNGTTGTSNGTTGTSNGTTSNDALGLRIGDDSARSCEVMISDANQSLKEVLFAPSVEGRSMRRGDNLAVAFFVKEDAPIANGAVSFTIEGPTEGVTLTVSRCFDRPGAAIADPGLDLKLQ